MDVGLDRFRGPVDRQFVEHDLVGLKDAGPAVCIEKSLHGCVRIGLLDDAESEIARRRRHGGVDHALQARFGIIDLRYVDREANAQRQDGRHSAEQNGEIAAAMADELAGGAIFTYEVPHSIALLAAAISLRPPMPVQDFCRFGFGRSPSAMKWV